MVPPDALSVVLLPIQIVVLPEAEIEEERLTTTDASAVSAQIPLETMTVYVVLTEGETEMDELLAPVLHE